MKFCLAVLLALPLLAIAADRAVMLEFFTWDG